jgi:type VI secretion system protein ImpA
MSFDVDALLQPITADRPCGDNLEYDPAFQELERTAAGKPETQFSEAEPPDWRQVRNKALEVLKRSRDLRILTYLAQSSLHLGHWDEFRDSLHLMQALLTQHWGAVHPQLDPDDGDPTFRVNAVVELCHPDSILDTLRNAPLVSSRLVGQFSLRDVEITQGKLQVNLPEDQQPKLAEITAAFMDVEIDVLQTTASALSEATDYSIGIERVMTEQLGASQAPDLSALVHELRNAHSVVAEQLAARGVNVVIEDESEATTAEGTVSSGGTAAAAPISGEINSREDVKRMLDKICAYYNRAEPSSPVPILLHRAKRLVAMDFMDILKDVAPDALGPVEKLRGKTEDE